MILSFGKGWGKGGIGTRMVVGGLAIVVIAGIFYGYRDWKEARDFVPQDFNTFMEVERSDREIENYTRFMEKAYREDIYGGTTPEETLKLFTDALKAGDTELAAKYFMVEKQEEMGDTLDHWKSIKKLNVFMDSVSDYVKTDYISTQTAQIPILRSGRANMVIYFNFNDQTNKWKIESL